MNLQQERDLRDNLYEQFARVCKALGSAKRFELIDLLANGEYSVDDLADETDMTIANTSQHLQLLKAARLVNIRRKGVEIFYRLASPMVFSLIRDVQELAGTSLAELDRITDQIESKRTNMEIITVEVLEERMAAGSVYLLDVRPQNEYDYAHIPGAVTIPLESLADKVNHLPRGRQMVVYCRSYFSMLSDRAIEILAQENIKAIRLVSGLAEWRSSGRPVETSLVNVI